jgi:hypothetical protein
MQWVLAVWIHFHDYNDHFRRMLVTVKQEIALFSQRLSNDARVLLLIVEESNKQNASTRWTLRQDSWPSCRHLSVYDIPFIVHTDSGDTI